MSEREPISFARGAPSPDLLPVDVVDRAAHEALANDGVRALSYGDGYGHPDLRSWVAERHDVSVEQVMITNGSLEGAVLLFEDIKNEVDDALDSRGSWGRQSAAIEDPTYDRTLLKLRELGYSLQPFGMDRDGIDVQALMDASERGRIDLVHVIPNFQNPGGTSLSDEKRQALADFGESDGLLIFEDDPYADIRFTGEPVPTILSRDPKGNVVYASSFSKTMAPGLRVGYLVGPEKDIGRMAVRAGNRNISANMLAQSIANEACRTGMLEENIRSVNEELSRRCDALADAVRKHLPGAEFEKPEGGYFLWARIPGMDGNRISTAAKHEGVGVLPGSNFSANEETAKDCIRLSFASAPLDQIDEGVSRLAIAVEKAA